MALSADEGSMYDNLIASQRIGDWMHAIKQGSPKRQLTPLKKLLKSVKSQTAYIDEALRLGVIDQLKSLIERTDDKDVMEVAADVITACSGAIAAPPQVSYFDCGGGTWVAIAEGSLSDGLGVRVWLAAHALARTLVAAPKIVEGCTVAEFGAGPGLVGLVASRLGASQVVLTDSEEAVLHCLRASVAANTAADQAAHPLQVKPHNGASTAEQRGSSGLGNPGPCRQSTSEGPNELGVHAAAGSDGCDWDPEDADSSEDLDILSPAHTDHSNKANSHNDSWCQDTIQVRQLDWRTVVESKAPHSSTTNVSPTSPPCDCPTLEVQSKFKVILASDVVYEAESAAALAAALTRHLEAEGRALLCCPVRDQALFDLFLASVQKCNLSAIVRPVHPLDSDTAVSGQVQDYEGGFQLVAVQHNAAVPFDWPWKEALSWQVNDCSPTS